MEETNEGRKPYKLVYTIIEKPGKSNFWMKIGIARQNHDGSWNVYLDALPFDRKLQIRDEKPRFEQQQDRLLPPPSSFDVGSIQ